MYEQVFGKRLSTFPALWSFLPAHGRSRGTLQLQSSYRTRTGIWRTCTGYPGTPDETKKLETEKKSIKFHRTKLKSQRTTQYKESGH